MEIWPWKFILTCKSLFGMPGLLDFQVILRGKIGQEVVQLELYWLEMGERDADVKAALQAVLALAALDLQINHHFDPAHPGSQRKRLIHDHRN